MSGLVGRWRRAPGRDLLRPVRPAESRVDGFSGCSDSGRRMKPCTRLIQAPIPSMTCLTGGVLPGRRSNPMLIPRSLAITGSVCSRISGDNGRSSAVGAESVGSPRANSKKAWILRKWQKPSGSRSRKPDGNTAMCLWRRPW